jgi:hypothetical protein
MKNLFLTSLSILALILMAQLVTAQPTLLPSLPGPPVSALPIDGGLSLIIGGGIAYAAKKAYAKKKS